MAKKKDDTERTETEGQKEMREYHEGVFQTHDPITHEERDLDQKPTPARVDRGETIEDMAEGGK